MSTEALKPCPFCLGEGLTIACAELDVNLWIAGVHCNKCKASSGDAEEETEQLAKQEAAKLWNARATATPAPADEFPEITFRIGNRAMEIWRDKDAWRYDATSFDASGRLEYQEGSLALDEENVRKTLLWLIGDTAPAPADKLAVLLKEALIRLTPNRNDPEIGVAIYAAEAFCERINAALATYESARGAGGGWIACKNRLPSGEHLSTTMNTVRLQVFCPDTHIRIGWYHEAGFWRLEGSPNTWNVTHWCPLLPPPTETK